MWTPAKLADDGSVDYGFGWSVSPYRGHRAIGHTGSWQGFKTMIQRFPDDSLTVIVLANLAETLQRPIVYGVAGSSSIAAFGESLTDLSVLKVGLARAVPSMEPPLIVAIVFLLLGWSRGLYTARNALVPLIINIVLAAWLWSAKPKS